jgi:hypothetical protein
MPLAFRFTVYSLLLIVLLSSCRATGQDASQPSLEQIALEKLGADTHTTYNTQKNFALCQQAQDPKDIGKAVRFFVVRLNDMVIVEEGSFTRGHVKWINDNTIEVFSLPGKVQWNEDMSKFKKEIKVDQLKSKL